MADHNPYARAPLTAQVGARIRVHVPYRPAADWIACIVSNTGTPALLVGLTDPETGDLVTECLMDGRLSVREAQEASYALLTASGPYKWWKTARLLALSARPDVAGHLTLEGLDPHTLTVSQWVTAVYALFTKGREAKDVFKFDAPLDDPPPGVADDEWMGEDDFSAMIAAARNAPGQQ